MQGAYPQGVTIAPEDVELNPSPDSFEGKLVIMFDGHRPFGEPATFAGREFWVRDSDGEAPDPEDLIPLDDPADNSDAQGADPRQPESLPGTP